MTNLWTEAVEYVRRACDRAAVHGIRVALDSVSPDFLTASPHQVRRFLEDVDRPNAGWNLDPAFLSLYGFPLDEAIDAVGPWIYHAHIKDHRRPPDDPPWVVPGDGDMDHGAWARALEQIGFDGVVTAEVIARPKGIPERWPLSYACERSMTTFRAAFGMSAQRPT
jgi:sugar phosphate isomerase/epimerase